MFVPAVTKHSYSDQASVVLIPRLKPMTIGYTWATLSLLQWSLSRSGQLSLDFASHALCNDYLVDAIENCIFQGCIHVLKLTP